MKPVFLPIKHAPFLGSLSFEERSLGAWVCLQPAHPAPLAPGEVEALPGSTNQLPRSLASVTAFAQHHANPHPGGI